MTLWLIARLAQEKWKRIHILNSNTLQISSVTNVSPAEYSSDSGICISLSVPSSLRVKTGYLNSHSAAFTLEINPDLEFEGETAGTTMSRSKELLESLSPKAVCIPQIFSFCTPNHGVKLQPVSNALYQK